MNKIEVTNSAVIINNYEFGDSTQLENNFKLYNPVTHSFYYMGIYYDKKNKKLYLPRGIDIWFVEKCLNADATILENKCYKYQCFNDIYIKTLPRDEVQKEALRFSVGQGEYRYTALKSQLSINLPTGKGKTYITIATLAYFSIRGIVITDTVDWLKQWKNRTVEYTNINEKDICIIEGSKTIFRLLNLTEDKLKRYKLFLVTHDTLQSYGSTYGWEKVGELFEYLKIGIKIYDEAHLDFDNICMIDFFTNVYKTYYLTATPAKSNQRENQIYQAAFKNVPAIDLFDEENDPHTAYFAIMYNSNPLPQDISNCRNNTYGMDRNKYTNYVVKQPEFYKLLTVIMNMGIKRTKLPGDKFMLYIGTNNAIMTVYQWLIENFQELENDIGIYTSIVSQEDKQLALSKRIILTTTKSAGAAIDIKGLKMTVVLAEPFKSEVIARQLLGRTRDNDTICIECVDKGFTHCRNYYYAKKPIYKKYATSCSEINLSMPELHAKYKDIMEERNKPNLIRLFNKIDPDRPIKLFHKIE